MNQEQSAKQIIILNLSYSKDQNDLTRLDLDLVLNTINLEVI